MYLSGVFTTPVGFTIQPAFGPSTIQVVISVSGGILFGFIAVLCLVGAFGVRNNMADVYICIGFGILGFLLQRYRIPTAPLILGVILGPLAERYFLTSMIAYDNNFMIFLTRPLSGFILFLSFAFLVWSFWELIQKRFRNFRKYSN